MMMTKSKPVAVQILTLLHARQHFWVQVTGISTRFLREFSATLASPSLIPEILPTEGGP